MWSIQAWNAANTGRKYPHVLILPNARARYKTVEVGRCAWGSQLTPECCQRRGWKKMRVRESRPPLGFQAPAAWRDESLVTHSLAWLSAEKSLGDS